MHIYRCECHLVTFATMKEWCDKQQSRDFTSVQLQFKCGTSCGLCVPYVKRMLRTGETVFHEIVTERSEPPRA